MKHKRFLALCGLLALGLAACDVTERDVPDEFKNDDAMMEDDAMMDDDDMMGVIMKGGSMMTVWEGGATAAMEEDVMMQDGTKVMMDGKVMKTDGTSMMMQEGQMMDMQGMMQEGGMMKNDDAMMDGEGAYTAYSDGVLTNGETKVLFFAASWCPICQDADRKLTEWYNGNEFGRSVYKVDYDTSAELKARYGVVTQHTFVVVDGEGNKISSHSGPSDTELQGLLNS